MLNVKEITFNKIVQWLRDYGFTVDEQTRNKDPSADIQFRAKVYPPGQNPSNQESLFFKIVFDNRFPDAFSIQSSVGLSEGESNTIDKGMKRREREQIYIDIHRLVFALHINCDYKFPIVKIHKLIFIDALKDKQFFFDCVFDIIHAMILVEGRFDELINRYYPTE